MECGGTVRREFDSVWKQTKGVSVASRVCYAFFGWPIWGFHVAS